MGDVGNTQGWSIMLCSMMETSYAERKTPIITVTVMSACELLYWKLIHFSWYWCGASIAYMVCEGVGWGGRERKGHIILSAPCRLILWGLHELCLCGSKNSVGVRNSCDIIYNTKQQASSTYIYMKNYGFRGYFERSTVMVERGCILPVPPSWLVCTHQVQNPVGSVTL